MNTFKPDDEFLNNLSDNEIISEITNKNQAFDKTFTISRIIGEGSSGYTLEAEIGKSGKTVALKYIRADSILFKNMNKELFKKTILNEISIHYNLKHENICNFLGYYDISDNFIIALELCQYGNIKDFLKILKRRYNRKINVSEQLVSYFSYQILQALKKIHKHNIVHFDIKIENILIDDEFNVKLSDFSISQRINKKFSRFKYSSCGTGVYIAPENLYCEEVPVEDTFKSDLYSFGVLIYKLIFKRNPYGLNDYDSKIEIEKKLKENTLIFPEDKSISSDLKLFLKGVLEKNVNKRWDMKEIESHVWIRNSQLIFGNLEYYNNKENFIMDLMNDELPEFYEDSDALRSKIYQNELIEKFHVKSSHEIQFKSIIKGGNLCNKKRKSVTCC